MAKIALFSGAARGLGRSIVQKFLDSGWTVIGIDLVCEEQDQPLLYWYQCDVSHYDALEKTLREIFARFGTIDALVNCIRHRQKKNAVQNLHLAWKQGMEVGLYTYYYTSALVCEILKENNLSGSIINMASILSDLINVQEAVTYHTAKAGIIQMTRHLAVQYGPYNIRANSVSPGLICKQGGVVSEQMTRCVPLRRGGAPEEIADLILFLAS